METLHWGLSIGDAPSDSKSSESGNARHLEAACFQKQFTESDPERRLSEPVWRGSAICSNFELSNAKSHQTSRAVCQLMCAHNCITMAFGNQNFWSQTNYTDSVEWTEFDLERSQISVSRPVRQIRSEGALRLSAMAISFKIGPRLLDLFVQPQMYFAVLVSILLLITLIILICGQLDKSVHLPLFDKCWRSAFENFLKLIFEKLFLSCESPRPLFPHPPLDSFSG